MTALLIRLQGALQSWGDESRFEIRGTRRSPSKSGIIGIIAAALGRDREADIYDLASMRVHIRTLVTGTFLSDYQIANNVAQFDHSALRNVVSHKHALAGADFLAAIEGPPLLLEAIDQALHHPVYPLYLGRAAYIPSLPIWTHEGVVAMDARAALFHPTWDTFPIPALCLYEDATGQEIWHDQPVSFALAHSLHIERRVRRVWDTGK